MSPRQAALLVLTALSLGAPAAAGGAGPPPVAPPETHVPLSGCRPGYVRPDFAALGRKLQTARARWAASGPGNYSYEIRQIAAPVLLPETRVIVTRGQVTRAEVLPGEAGMPSPLSRQSVEQRFRSIEQTLIRQRNTRCPEIQLSFDAALGYPTRFYSGLGDAGIADGFGEWTLKNFRPLR
ncbi:DUF6174 domain-containing protein [Deinococcus navajonensis]|uniref:DUF6174 domain-containing protein n=1 Tax=Deinococcus navajonensis TaxID=309884 RepID=A0ABV8XN33_9DEIO